MNLTRGPRLNGLLRPSARRLKLEGVVLLALYASPFFVGGVAYWGRLEYVLRFFGISAALAVVAMVGYRWPRLGGVILILPSLVSGVLVIPLALLFEPGVGGVVVLLLFFGTPFVAGLLFLMAGRRARRVEGRGHP